MPDPKPELSSDEVLARVASYEASDGHTPGECLAGHMATQVIYWKQRAEVLESAGPLEHTVGRNMAGLLKDAQAQLTQAREVIGGLLALPLGCQGCDGEMKVGDYDWYEGVKAARDFLGGRDG